MQSGKNSGLRPLNKQKYTVTEAPEKAQKTNLATLHSKILNNTFEDDQIAPGVKFPSVEAIACTCERAHVRERVLQRVQSVAVRMPVRLRVQMCASVLQCVAVCCSVIQCDAVCCSVLQCVAVCCSVLQCVAVCCSVL